MRRSWSVAKVRQWEHLVVHYRHMMLLIWQVVLHCKKHIKVVKINVLTSLVESIFDKMSWSLELQTIWMNRTQAASFYNLQEHDLVWHLHVVPLKFSFPGCWKYVILQFTSWKGVGNRLHPLGGGGKYRNLPTSQCLTCSTRPLHAPVKRKWRTEEKNFSFFLS